MSEQVGLVPVHLLGVPLPTRTRYLQHLDALVRELALLRIGAEQHPETSLPPRLLRIAGQLRSAYAPHQPGPAAVMEAAAAAGEEFCDVTYELPLTLLPLARDMLAGLEEADDFCRRERRLLTLPATQEVVAYRRWLFGEFQRQLVGRAPRPWDRSSAPAAAPGRPATSPPGPVTAPADGSSGEVVGGPLVMEPVAGSVAAARRHVRRVLTHLDVRALEESAELGVSELVSNAILHAQTRCTLTVRAVPTGRVRIEVSDASPSPVQVRHFDVAASTGRGVRLVAAVSSAWGVEALAPGRGPGKTVWFEPAETVPGDGTGIAAWDLTGLV